MKPKTLYLALCIAGTVLPYSQLLPFLLEQGLDIRLIFEQLFSNRIGGFFGLDVIVTSVVLWVLVLTEGRRIGVKHLWSPIAANLSSSAGESHPRALTEPDMKLAPHPAPTIQPQV